MVGIWWISHKQHHQAAPPHVCLCLKCTWEIDLHVCSFVIPHVEMARVRTRTVHGVISSPGLRNATNAGRMKRVWACKQSVLKHSVKSMMCFLVQSSKAQPHCSARLSVRFKSRLKTDRCSMVFPKSPFLRYLLCNKYIVLS